MHLPSFLRNPIYPVAACVAIAGSTLAFLTGGGAAQAEAARTPTQTATTGASASRADLIHSFQTRFTGGTIPLSEATGEVREFTLEVHEIEAEIAPGVTVDQWAFAFPGQQPTVPGPEIRVMEGDLVRITLRNAHNQPHSIHPHGITSLAVEGDGVDSTSHIMVMPGQEYTYEFVAAKAGTHVYHCHIQTYSHLDMGMYGSLVIEPRDEQGVWWDREHTLILDEWDSAQDPLAGIHDPEPDAFLINGKAFPLTEPMEVLEGERALIRVINMGYQSHALHLHGMSFLVIAKDGHDLPAPYEGDTLAIAPGERYDLLVNGRDGTFPIHDHVVDNVTNGGVYPGGMLTLIKGSEGRRTSDDPRSVYYGAEAQPQPIEASAAEARSGGMRGSDHGQKHAHTRHATAANTASADSSGTAEGGDSGAVLAGNVEVRISNFEFDTPVLRIKKGTTVTWVNDDSAPHTVTAGLPGADPASRAFDSTGAAEGRMDMMAQGDAWSFTFDEAGEFDYYCLPHPYMTAKVIVEP